jgi:hypothetical protein
MPMPHTYVRGLAFDAETTRVLNGVFDQVTLTLSLDGTDYSPDRVPRKFQRSLLRLIPLRV